LDGRFRPLAPAISWLDTRAGEDYQALLPELNREEVRETVGWPWTRRFPLTQLAWLRKHRPRLYSKARYFTPDTAYYHQELTGRLAIDHSSATTFLLQDQKRRQWHGPFLSALGIEPSALPDLVAPGAPIGGLTAKAARTIGLPQGLPVIAGSFDHPSAAIGSGVLNVGDLLLSCGTSWVGFFPTVDRAAALSSGLIVDPFRQPLGPWGAMFALTAVGTTIDRYLTSVFPLPKSLSLAERYQRFEAAAATVTCGKEGPPIDPLAAPPTGRAACAALCRGYSLGQLSRRLMAGTALAMRRRLVTLTAAGFNPRRVIIVGGPSNSATWTQIVADVLGRELYLAGSSMAGATGAAMLGGMGVGFFRDATDAVNSIQLSLTQVTPEPSARAW
ncbi:MAG: FGGY family carbohydrate kinase, partial [Opitutaceae bacterium]|nr:FGGY family carbohydrate kinase [Opitutaceae bacterium]